MQNFDGFCSVLRRRADAAAILAGSAKYPDIHGMVLFYGLRGGVIVNKSGRSLGGSESAAVLGEAVIGAMALGEG